MLHDPPDWRRDRWYLLIFVIFTIAWIVVFLALSIAYQP